MEIAGWVMAWFTEERLFWLMEQFHALGPLPGILLTFLKSFVPPLPTAVIIGLNAAVYGFVEGFIYSWIGLISGCLVTFLAVRKIGDSRYLKKWASKPKVIKGMQWIQRNGFSYVFMLGVLPIGPFVAVNIAAGLSRMPIQSFLLAVILGKGIMVFCVSFIGANISDFLRQPIWFAAVIGGAFILLQVSKKVESYMLKSRDA